MCNTVRCTLSCTKIELEHDRTSQVNIVLGKVENYFCCGKSFKPPHTRTYQMATIS